MKCSIYMNFPDNERLSLWNTVNLEAKFCFFIFIRMSICTCICASQPPKQNRSTLFNIVDGLRRVTENYRTITLWYSVSWSLAHIGATWELVKNIYSWGSFQKSLFRSVDSASLASFPPDSGPSSQENHTWRSLAFESITEQMILVLPTTCPIVSTSFHDLFNAHDNPTGQALHSSPFFCFETKPDDLNVFLGHPATRWWSWGLKPACLTPGPDHHAMGPI